MQAHRWLVEVVSLHSGRIPARLVPVPGEHRGVPPDGSARLRPARLARPPQRRGLLPAGRLASALALLVGMAACGAPPVPGDGTPADDLERIQARGTLVMLCVPHQESAFVRTRLEAGPMRRTGTPEHFEGADVDLVRALAESLGVALEIRPAIGKQGVPAYSALIPSLLDGQGDLVASSFSITPQRARRVDFSDPYYTNRQVVVARRESGLEGIEDLEGLTSSTVRGSSQHERLVELGFSGDQLFFSAFAFESYIAVAEGQAALSVVDSASASRVLSRFPELDAELEVAFVLPGEDYYGVAVRPGSDLLGVINEFLEQARSDGRLEEFLARHLGRGPRH